MRGRRGREAICLEVRRNVWPYSHCICASILVTASLHFPSHLFLAIGIVLSCFSQASNWNGCKRDTPACANSARLDRWNGYAAAVLSSVNLHQLHWISKLAYSKHAMHSQTPSMPTGVDSCRSCSLGKDKNNMFWEKKQLDIFILWITKLLSWFISWLW